MGGLGTGSAFRANIQALSALRFNMRVLHDISAPDLSVALFDRAFSMPVLAAPIGGVSFNMGGQVSEGDYIRAVLGGCNEKGTLGCVGDGVPPFIHQEGYAAIKDLGGRGIPFIKPWEDRELIEKLELAVDTGADLIGMDVDAAGLVTLRLMGRPVSPKSPQRLREIIGKVPAKFILKGIMTPDEARLAMDVGAHGIVVSNHGGRVLDHTPGGAEVLPEIARIARGKIVVLADGGVRSGGDVLKMLALGADAVMIGRPFSIAAVGGLADGVKAYLDRIRAELTSAMVLTGTSSVRSVSMDILRLG